MRHRSDLVGLSFIALPLSRPPSAEEVVDQATLDEQRRIEEEERWDFQFDLMYQMCRLMALDTNRSKLEAPQPRPPTPTYPIPLLHPAFRP